MLKSWRRTVRMRQCAPDEADEAHIAVVDTPRRSQSFRAVDGVSAPKLASRRPDESGGSLLAFQRVRHDSFQPFRLAASPRAGAAPGGACGGWGGRWPRVAKWNRRTTTPALYLRDTLPRRSARLDRVWLSCAIVCASAQARSVLPSPSLTLPAIIWGSRARSPHLRNTKQVQWPAWSHGHAAAASSSYYPRSVSSRRVSPRYLAPLYRSRSATCAPARCMR